MARAVSTLPASKDAGLPALLASYALAEHDPASIAEVMRENVGSGGIGRFDLDRIKVPAGGGTVWSIPTLDGEEPAKEIVGVIIQFVDQRAYWREAFGGGSSPPDCSSVDGRVGVGDPGGDCDDCPFSKYGTAVKQDGVVGRGQACRSIRALYVLLPMSILPTIIAVPPSSLKAARQYFLRLMSQGIAYHAAQTRMKLRQTKSADGIAYSEMIFEFAGRLSPEDTGKIRPLKEMMQGQVQTVDAADFNTGA